MSYQLYSLKERPDLRGAFVTIGDSVWPDFMGWDAVLRKHWDDLDNIFPEYQFVLCDGDGAIGLANSIPWRRDMPLEELPEEGWDWVVKKGIKDKEDGIMPNTLSGLQVAIAKEHQGKGLSPVMVREMIAAARKNGLEKLAIPVRPTVKSKYPLIPISRYIQWKRADGLPFDPWMRVHVKLGASIIKPCHHSMYIEGSIEQWEQYTGMEFPESGEYVIEGALTPIQIDRDKNTGVYIEPNVWIVHEISLKEGKDKLIAP